MSNVGWPAGRGFQQIHVATSNQMAAEDGLGWWNRRCGRRFGRSGSLGGKGGGGFAEAGHGGRKGGTKSGFHPLGIAGNYFPHIIQVPLFRRAADPAQVAEKNLEIGG